jgi:PKD repeat protein
MKFKFLFLCAFLYIFSVSAFSQCIPDYEYLPTYSFGLSPDSLPEGNLMEEYQEDLTFFLPLDTFVEVLGQTALIAFEDFHIISISLPVGLVWECNNSNNDCHYNPQDNQYGCVRISGTPLQQGMFDVQVTVIATHEASDLVGTEEVSFSLPLFIGPGAINNEGFSMSNYSGCAPLNVEFTNNNPNFAMYNWSFGNNMTTDDENPGSITYSNSGTYIINYEAYSFSDIQYNLNNVTIQAASGWGVCLEDLFGDPDPYFLIEDAQGVEIYLSPFIENQNFPVSFDLSINLQPNQNYKIMVYDDDGTFSGEDDFLGEVFFSTSNLNGVLNQGDLMVSYSISEILPTSELSFSDTVYVYQYPQEVEFIYDEYLNIFSLVGDSLNLNYQWNLQNTPVALANNTSFSPIESGYYSLSITNNSGCAISTEPVLAVICNENYIPSINIDNSLIFCNNSESFDCQWLLDNEVISGATTSELLINQVGAYSVVQTDEWGCVYQSEEFEFNPASISSFDLLTMPIFPNPFTTSLYIDLSSIEYKVDVSLYDFKGSLVRNYLNILSDEFILNREDLTSGIYTLRIYSKNLDLRKKIIIN